MTHQNHVLARRDGFDQPVQITQVVINALGHAIGA